MDEDARAFHGRNLAKPVFMKKLNGVVQNGFTSTRARSLLRATKCEMERQLHRNLSYAELGCYAGQAASTKWYATVELERLSRDPVWLDRAIRIVDRWSASPTAKKRARSPRNSLLGDGRFRKPLHRNRGLCFLSLFVFLEGGDFYQRPLGVSAVHGF